MHAPAPRRPFASHSRGILIAAALATALPACSTPRAAHDHRAMPPDEPAALNLLLARMQGSFSSADQASRDPDAFMDIRLHMTRIWPERTDGAWLYVEQATAARPDRPYRQRVYRVAPVGPAEPGVIASEVFELPGDPLLWTGAWRQPARFDTLDRATLLERAGCAVYLTLAPDAATHTGGTRGQGCASTLRGAAYATSEVLVADWGLRTWDRGYDAAGTQVWGSTAGPYEFKRSEPDPQAP